MATGKDWERLAEFVRERRIELDMTQEDVRAAGGPSTATMRLIEGALQQNYQPATLRDLERVLQWERGSVSRILGGGEPEHLAAPVLAPVPNSTAVSPPPRRERRLKALEDSDPEGLAPILQAVRRELYAAAGILGMFSPGADLPGPEDLPELVPLLDALPGEVAFPESTTEPAIWETRDRLSVPERIRLVARIRHMAAKHGGTGQRDRRVSGLTPGWHGNGADDAVQAGRYQAGIT